MMFKTSEELKKAGQELLEMCEQHERGEISTEKLLQAWKLFTQMGYQYLDSLKKEIEHNVDWN